MKQPLPPPPPPSPPSSPAPAPAPSSPRRNFFNSEDTKRGRQKTRSAGRKMTLESANDRRDDNDDDDNDDDNDDDYDTASYRHPFVFTRRDTEILREAKAKIVIVDIEFRAQLDPGIKPIEPERRRTYG
ncbi:hypothetical protein M0802_003256 [Mischocyttarus mexicanus]|nr:hypothetical protein M0802_003256 [Mischocyttarus mexicanus]